MNKTENIKPKADGTKYFGVKFKSFDKIFSILNLRIPVTIDDKVVVETNRGQELGTISLKTDFQSLKKRKYDLEVNSIVRIATEEDLKIYDQMESDEKKVFLTCMKKNDFYQCPVRFIKVEKIFDGSRYIVHYRKNEPKKPQPKKKSNLQSLSIELSSHFETKIEFREVGQRGEAKIFGGVGHCGKALCCTSWIKKGCNVSIKMAKEQGLAVNIPKLTGSCGRLICCLSYEKQNYQDGRMINE
jgi:cell fate regulator YaaT (PSP1 superfamily)